ncbi:unnamed protein product [Effrenium voratum]|nr:unnamed protein product [Effrenium voratum]
MERERSRIEACRLFCHKRSPGGGDPAHRAGARAGGERERAGGYPFFIWAALFFLLPALGMAMGLLWAAMFLTLVFAMVLGLAELVKEALARRLEAEEQAARIAAEIEAEIQAARQEAQKTLAPSCPEEAQALQAEAQEELQAARSHLEAAEEAAREQSGGWMQVCEARERLKEAHSRARHAELLLPKQSRSQMRQLLPAARGFSAVPPRYGDVCRHASAFAASQAPSPRHCVAKPGAAAAKRAAPLNTRQMVVVSLVSSWRPITIAKNGGTSTWVTPFDQPASEL